MTGLPRNIVFSSGMMQLPLAPLYDAHRLHYSYPLRTACGLEYVSGRVTNSLSTGNPQANMNM